MSGAEPEVQHRSVTLATLCEEPFRVIFPSAAVAGLVGVLLWPLHLTGGMEWYPGVNHARIMTQGFFGGFMLGFLGTALRRLLSVPGLRAPELLFLWILTRFPSQLVRDRAGTRRLRGERGWPRLPPQNA
jgi:uncharacterized protein involved in response to NO